MKRTLNIGFNNIVLIDKIISILSIDSAPVRRLIKNAKDEMMFIDATYGRKSASIIVLESNHIVVTSVNRETLMKRIEE